MDKNTKIGTIMEIVYTTRVYLKPCYIVVTNGEFKHPWLQYHGTRLFESLGDMEKFLEKQAPKEEPEKLPEFMIPSVWDVKEAPADEAVTQG